MSTRIDIFNFIKYKREYNIFALFYSGLELYLRTAIFLDYKYNYLSKANRAVVKMMISKKTGKPLLLRRDEPGTFKGRVLNKKYFDDFTNVFEPKRLMKMWYLHFQPGKLQQGFLDDALEKYREYEDVAFNKMYKVYVDKDWTSKPLWFTKEYRHTSSGEQQTMLDFYKLHP